MPTPIPALTHPSAPPPTWRIELDLLDPNPYQPRSQIDEGAIRGWMHFSGLDRARRAATDGSAPEQRQIRELLDEDAKRRKPGL